MKKNLVPFYLPNFIKEFIKDLIETSNGDKFLKYVLIRREITSCFVLIFLCFFTLLIFNFSTTYSMTLFIIFIKANETLVLIDIFLLDIF